MTPGERDRLARLEQRVEGMDEWMRSISGDVKKLVGAANMANGAWGATLKIGGILLVVAGFIAWLVEKAAWLWQKFGHSALAIVLMSGAALAHGDAEWIMREPGYVSNAGSHCCGPSDCERMPADVEARLRQIPGGWELDGVTFKYGEKGMYASVDSGWWWCRIGTPRCLFEPQRGA